MDLRARRLRVRLRHPPEHGGHAHGELSEPGSSIARAITGGLAVGRRSASVARRGRCRAGRAARAARRRGRRAAGGASTARTRAAPCSPGPASRSGLAGPPAPVRMTTRSGPACMACAGPLGHTSALSRSRRPCRQRHRGRATSSAANRRAEAWRWCTTGGGPGVTAQWSSPRKRDARLGARHRRGRLPAPERPISSATPASVATPAACTSCAGGHRAQRIWRRSGAPRSHVDSSAALGTPSEVPPGVAVRGTDRAVAPAARPRRPARRPASPSIVRRRARRPEDREATPVASRPTRRSPRRLGPSAGGCARQRRRA